MMRKGESDLMPYPSKDAEQGDPEDKKDKCPGNGDDKAQDKGNHEEDGRKGREAGHYDGIDLDERVSRLARGGCMLARSREREYVPI